MRVRLSAFVALLSACASAHDPASLADASWSVDSVPVFDLGRPADDTAAVVGFAVAAFRVDDSLIVVADRGYSALRYFDLAGTLRDSVGRVGDGPGEFRYLARAFLCGDSLVTLDIEHRQFDVFSARGVHARSFRLVAPKGGIFTDPYYEACGPTGVWLANGWDTVSTRELARVRGQVPYWLADRDGRRIALLGDWPGSERLTGPNGSRPHPLGKEAVIAVGRTRAYIGTADSFAIMVFDLNGAPIDTIRREGVALATTDADRQRYRLLDTLGQDASEIDRRLREWETFEFPLTVPAYTALLVDRADNLWVRLYPRSEQNLVRWIVFDPAGQELGQLDLPATLAVSDIGTDYILGVETRLDDGGQQVRMYRLHR
jgi:hypothetical protein